MRPQLIALFGILSSFIYYFIFFKIPSLHDVQTPHIEPEFFFPNPQGFSDISLYLLFMGLLFILYILPGLSFWYPDFDFHTKNGGEPLSEAQSIQMVKRGSEDRRSLGIILFFGILFRILALYSSPLLDDDIYRYLFDGHLVSNGVSPYLFPPEAEELEKYRIPKYYSKTNFTDIKTIYPPLTQWNFSLAFFFDNPFFGMKWVAFTWEILLALALFFLLKQTGQPLIFFHFYFWNPSVIKEWVNSAHLDPIPLFFLTLSLIASTQKKHYWAFFTLGLGGSAKFFPLLVAPLFFARFLILCPKNLRLKGTLWGLILLSGGFFIPFLPFQGDFADYSTGMKTFTTQWVFNPGPFKLLRDTLPLWVPPYPGEKVYEFNHRINLITRGLIGFFLLGITLGLITLVNLGENSIFLRSVFITYFLVILCAPTANTWYISWLALFLPFIHSPSALYFTFAGNLSYTFYLENQDIPVFRGLEYFPLGFLILLEGVTTWFSKRARVTENKKVNQPD